jgi:hypothetical protein
MGAVAKSYMRKGILIYEEMRKYLIIYKGTVGHLWLCNRSHLNFLIYEENLIFFFYHCLVHKLRRETITKNFLSIVKRDVYK